MAKKSAGRTILVVGCNGKKQSSIVIANALNKREITSDDKLIIQCSHDFETSLGVVQVCTSNEAVDLYLAAHPDGATLHQNGVFLENSPTVEHMQSVADTDKKRRAEGKRRQKAADKETETLGVAAAARKKEQTKGPA